MQADSELATSRASVTQLQIEKELLTTKHAEASKEMQNERQLLREENAKLRSGMGTQGQTTNGPCIMCQTRQAQITEKDAMLVAKD